MGPRDACPGGELADGDQFDVSGAYLIGETLEGPDTEEELVGMFRKASRFSDDERALLKSMMMNSLAETSQKRRATTE